MIQMLHDSICQRPGILVGHAGTLISTVWAPSMGLQLFLKGSEVSAPVLEVAYMCVLRIYTDIDWCYKRSIRIPHQGPIPGEHRIYFAQQKAARFQAEGLNPKLPKALKEGTVLKSYAGSCCG